MNVLEALNKPIIVTPNGIPPSRLHVWDDSKGEWIKFRDEKQVEDWYENVWNIGIPNVDPSAHE